MYNLPHLRGQLYKFTLQEPKKGSAFLEKRECENPLKKGMLKSLQLGFCNFFLSISTFLSLIMCIYNNTPNVLKNKQIKGQKKDLNSANI